MALSLLLLACSEFGLKNPDSDVVPAVSVTEHFQQAPLPGLDVLFVVDGTGSMAEEQSQLGAAAASFLNGLEAWQLSWQIGVVSMDAADGGALLGRPWILTPSTPAAEAVLAASLQVGTEHLPPAGGINAALAALNEENQANIGFRRSNASLHIIFVSDGDDQSEVGIEDYFLDWMNTEATATGRSVRASAVVGDVPDGCSSASGRATPGTRYVAVAEQTGGLVESICSADFGVIAAALGDEGVEWQRRFPLQAMPEAGSVVVYVDTERRQDWTLDGQVVVFAEPPAPGAEILVQYDLGGP